MSAGLLMKWKEKKRILRDGRQLLTGKSGWMALVVRLEPAMYPACFAFYKGERSMGYYDNLTTDIKQINTSHQIHT